MLFRCCGAIKSNTIRNVSFVLKIECKTGTSLQCRNLHIAQSRRQLTLANSLFLRSQNLLSVASVRSLSELPNTQSADPDLSDTLPRIPDAPPIPSADVTEVVSTFAANGEPTFASLGLGGYTPVGLIQTALEFLHISLDIPWWGVIMCGTIAVRTVLFPLVILAQRNAAKMSNNMPQMQVL